MAAPNNVELVAIQCHERCRAARARSGAHRDGRRASDAELVAVVPECRLAEVVVVLVWRMREALQLPPVQHILVLGWAE